MAKILLITIASAMLACGGGDVPQCERPAVWVDADGQCKLAISEEK